MISAILTATAKKKHNGLKKNILTVTAVFTKQLLAIIQKI